MKKKPVTQSRAAAADDAPPEQRFDYPKARTDNFAGRIYEGRCVVILDPDVAKIFPTSESVNAALRALITAMPKPVKVKASRKS